MMVTMLAGAALAAVQPAEAAKPIPPATLAEIDAAFATFAKDAPVPGMVYGIVRDGRLVHVRGIGVQDVATKVPVGADSLFRIASMSKAFTALAILKLRDEGRLRLDDLAEIHVPELKAWRYPTSDSPRLRIRDLLAHTSGFVTDDPWGDRQQVLSEADFTALLKQGVPFTRAPGEAMEYSNFGYALLGRIVTRASRRPYKDYIEQTIMRPLGMTSTGYEIGESPLARRAIGYRWENDAWVREPDMKHGTFGAMGGVQTSANDYAKWIAFLLDAWPARDGPEMGPVKRSTVREMAQGLNFVRTQMRPGARRDEPPCPLATAYAMGLITGQDCNFPLMLMHSGGYPGYGSFMMLLPDHRTGLFGFASRTYTGPARQVNEAAAALKKAGVLDRPADPVPDPQLIAGYERVAAAYQANAIAPLAPLAAMNFFMDRSAPQWDGVLADLRKQAGACDTKAPLGPTGRLAAGFQWRCEKGRLQGNILMAPTSPATVQALRFRFVAEPPAK